LLSPINFQVVLAAGVTGVLLGLVLILWGRSLTGRRGHLLSLLILVLLLAATGGAVALGCAEEGWLPLALLAGLWGLSWLLRSPLPARVVHGGLAGLGNPSSQAVLLVLSGVGGLFLWSQQLDDRIPQFDDSGEDYATRTYPELRKLAQPALTDRGKSVWLFVPRDAEKHLIQPETEERTYRGSSLKVIRTALPAPESNCHGWVFTGGRYWVAGGQVDQILQDNGYQTVSAAAVGDLIVYRNAGNVVHTGIVRAITDDGLVLVESKWMKNGRFLHAPEDQPYSPEWQFYHSPRKGHLLSGLDRVDPAKFAAE
jgi:hypothetical protein